MENEKIETSKKSNVWEFIKRNAYYIALALLILLLAVAIVVTSNLSQEEEQATPTSVETISFSSPVLNGTILKGYSDTELQFNKALGLWEIHKGVDFAAEVGTDVLAVYDGTVASVSTNLLDGTVIEIDHGDGLKTVYASLDSKVSVAVGDVVKKGDAIAKASNTATGETAGESEVHFEVWKDGNIVDPASYLDIAGK